MSKVSKLLNKYEGTNDYGVEYEDLKSDDLDSGISKVVDKHIKDNYIKVYSHNRMNTLVGYLCDSIPNNPDEFGVTEIDSGTSGSSKYKVYKFINSKMSSKGKVVISIKNGKDSQLIESQSTNVVNDMLSHEKHFDYYKDSLQS